jgi:hypothetical protein
MKLFGLATLMRVLTVLKETSFNLFGRVLPRAMVRAEPYHAVHLEYLPVINLGRNVPSLASSRAITCIHHYERGSGIPCLIVLCCEQWAVQSGTVRSGSTSQITSGLLIHCGLTAKVNRTNKEATTRHTIPYCT